jgi:hypothetical protein
VEFVVASTVAVILALALVPLATAPHTLWRQGEERIELQREMSLALKAIADRLREAKWVVVSGSGGEINFQNEETSARLYVDPDTQQLMIDDGSVVTDLANYVNWVRFVAYASRVEISLELEKDGETLQGATSAALRVLNLVGNWPFEEGSGEELVTFDSSPSGNNGALHNTSWIYDASLARDVLRFNSSGLDDPGFSYVRIPDSDALDVGQHAVYDFQVKPSSLDVPTPTLYSRGVPNPEQAFQQVCLDSSGRLVFKGSTGTDYQSVTSDPLTWEADTWYNIVVLIDNVNQQATFMRNGQYVPADGYDAPFLLEGTTGSGYLGIALDSEGVLDNGTAWNGDMNEVTIGKY